MCPPVPRPLLPLVNILSGPGPGRSVVCKNVVKLPYKSPCFFNVLPASWAGRATVGKTS